MEDFVAHSFADSVSNWPLSGSEEYVGIESWPTLQVG